jgi:hypothetical protein
MGSAELTLLRLLVAWAACLAFRLGLCGEGEGRAIVTEDAAEVEEKAALNGEKNRRLGFDGVVKLTPREIWLRQGLQ